ncbi:hypothetical protein JYU23_00980 [bacterium AH-315-C07]|nr:hypothetical protein [bacterium AH-315-C07]
MIAPAGETMAGMTLNLEENSLDIIDLYKTVIDLKEENRKLKERLVILEEDKTTIE